MRCMKFRKKSKTTLILFYILVSYASIPFFIGLESSRSSPSQNIRPLESLNGLDELESNLDDKTEMNTEIFSGISEKYDKELQTFLTELKVDDECCESGEIKTIVMFDKAISKIQRLNVLQSHFDNFEVIYNYDIISGAYIRIDPYELIDAETEIMEITGITKIYKSQTFTQPVITEDAEDNKLNSIIPSALDKADYSNWWLSAIGADGLTEDGSGVKIAIIDSGVYDHPGLTISESENFVSEDSTTNDLNGHGTHCAGIAAGNGDGSDGKFRGVAPGAEIINARAADSFGALDDGDIISAIQWADGRADIISMSFGGGQPAAYDPITAAIDSAVDAGVICVVSSGNSGPEYFTGGSPAVGTDAIAVGATNSADELASFSSWGPTYSYLGYPDVVAPGVDIISCDAKDAVISRQYRYIGDYFDFDDDADYIPLSGTSMSCPMVAGALAILKQAYPGITPETARIALLEGACSLSSLNDNELLKAGAGLINVSASLDFLDSLSSINDVAKAYPSELPIKPYDLLHFPGDQQQFNITLINGDGKNCYIQKPTITGISIDLDKSTLLFSDAGTKFFAIDIKINNNAVPKKYSFQINITDALATEIYDTINVSFEVKLPEYSVLMDSFHGLNDWLPEASFYQMDFYESMQKFATENVSLEYNALSWTPNYDEQLNNSLLTEERLGQYDLIVLQSPILPYSPREIKAINSYYSNGGNLLFLGTKSQQLCKDNINALFSTLGTGIQITDKNLLDDQWLGLGASVSTQEVTDLNHPEIFAGVNEFIWFYGTALSTSGGADSIATLDGETIAATYDGSSMGAGKLVAFGDLHWMGDYYDLSGYETQHSRLMENLINYYRDDNNVSLQLELQSQQTATGNLDLSLYGKYTQNNSLIPSSILTNELSVVLKNEGFSKDIIMSSTQDGIAFNNTYTIPSPNSNPYTFEANLTLSGTIYDATSKLLYFDDSLMPEIQALTVDNDNVTRASESVEIQAELDSNSYNDFNGYLALYSDSFYNNEQTINTTISFSHFSGNTYNYVYNPPYSAPSGLSMTYITPNSTSGSYMNAFVPRVNFYIYNNPPEFVEDESSFSINSGSEVLFKDTTSDEGGSYIYELLQEDSVNFKISVEDSVNYEDDPNDMQVYVNLFICTTTSDNYVSLIYPAELVVSEIEYNSDSKQHEGSLTIPKEMKYSSITGTKKISTETDVQSNGNILGLLYISVYDNEGGVNQFTIFLAIGASQDTDDLILWIIIIAIIAIIALIVIIVIVANKRNEKRY